MTTEGQGAANSRQRQWFIVGRWEQFGAEARANLLRILGVGGFYLIEILTYYGLRLGGLIVPPGADTSRDFHLAATALSVAWVAMALLVLLLLRERIFPQSLPYLSTAGDLTLLTCLLLLADGPRSPLIVGYFLVLALAATRFDLRLLWFTLAGDVAGYLVVLGYAKWFAKRDIMVARHSELIFVLALLLMAVVLGQMIRRVRQIADEYSRRVAADEQA